MKKRKAGRTYYQRISEVVFQRKKLKKGKLLTRRRQCVLSMLNKTWASSGPPRTRIGKKHLGTRKINLTLRGWVHPVQWMCWGRKRQTRGTETYNVKRAILARGVGCCLGGGGFTKRQKKKRSFPPKIMKCRQDVLSYEKAALVYVGVGGGGWIGLRGQGVVEGSPLKRDKGRRDDQLKRGLLKGVLRIFETIKQRNIKYHEGNQASDQEDLDEKAPMKGPSKNT